MRRTVVLLLCFALAGASWGSAALAGFQEIDYATFDARVTDTKGVVTELGDFGHATGPNVLMGYRGDADVEIPWRLIRVIEIREYVPENRRAPVKVTLRNGKAVDLEIDNVEEMRLVKGVADFGDFRIRFGKIRRLELFALSHTDRSTVE